MINEPKPLTDDDIIRILTEKNRYIFVVSGPSGCGKTSMVKKVLQNVADVEFSVSGTSRAKRPDDKPGQYEYFTADQFKNLIAEEYFLEYEEVYPGKFYGTSKREFSRIVSSNHHFMLLDIDVKGALDLKRRFGKLVHLIFIEPPTIDELAKRIIERNGGVAPADLDERLERAAYEINQSEKYDEIVVNDVREQAEEEVVRNVSNFIEKSMAA